MKTIATKPLSLLILLFIINSCTVIQAISDSYKYKVKYTQDSLPLNNNSVVTLDLYAKGKNGNYIVNTVWKKVEEDGSVKKDSIYLTSVDNSSSPLRLFIPNFARRKISRMIPPGLYYMHRFHYTDFNYTLSSRTANWHDETGETDYLAFRVEADQSVTFPSVRVEYEISNRVPIFSFDIENDNEVNGKWILGTRIKKSKAK